eukprot:scaffold17145_cov109-Isochrysis_galbana.AAC.3
MSWFPYPRGSCRLALQVLGAPRLGPVIPAGFGIGAVARYARRRSPRRHCSSPCSNSTHVRSTGDIQRVTREIQILKHVRHPNVVRLLEVIEKPRHIYLVTEFLAGGELCGGGCRPAVFPSCADERLCGRRREVAAAFTLARVPGHGHTS